MLRTDRIKTVFLLLLLTAGTFLPAEESDSGQTEVASAPAAQTESPAQTEISAQKKHSFFLSAGPLLMVNADSSKKSAPSPIMFSGGAGATLFQNLPVAFQPRLTFFMHYYLWDGECARPAEIENRTATVLSFLLDLNVVKIFRYQKHTFQAGGGLSLLARFGILSAGLEESGSGLSGTNSSDLSEINSWFWSGARFLYPDLTFCWLYDLPRGWKAGLSAHVYIPMGSLADGRGMDGTLITICGRLEI
ncbi:MAG: hypothetical protein IKS40_09015 [Treponema sp.]|nr:hypothetical protein [Treponema sp.]